MKTAHDRVFPGRFLSYFMAVLLATGSVGAVASQSSAGTKSASVGQTSAASPTAAASQTAIQSAPDIHQMARTGNPQQIRNVLANKVYRDTPDSNGITPLMYAAWFNPDPGVVSIFLDAGARLEYSPGSGLTAAALSVWNANPAVFELLKKRGANVSVVDEYGTTLLMLAARFNRNPEVLRSIIRAESSGKAVGARNRWGWTALMFAAESNPSPAVLDLLLDEGSDMGVSDDRGRTVWFLVASANPNPEMFAHLQKKSGEKENLLRTRSVSAFSGANAKPVEIQ